MTESTKTLLIVGGVALGAYLLYKKFTAGRVVPTTLTHQGTGQSVSAATGQGAAGSAGFWATLGNIGQGLNAGTSAVESTYNNIYDLFGGQPSTASTGGNPGSNG